MSTIQRVVQVDAHHPPLSIFISSHTYVQPVKRGLRTPDCAPTTAPTMRPTVDGETYRPTKQPTPAPVGVDTSFIWTGGALSHDDPHPLGRRVCPPRPRPAPASLASTDPRLQALACSALRAPTGTRATKQPRASTAPPARRACRGRPAATRPAPPALPSIRRT